MSVRKHQIFIGSCLPTCTSDQRFIYLVIGFILGIIAYVVVEYVIFGRKKLVDEDLLVDNHKLGNNNLKLGNNNHNEFNNLGKN